MEQLVATMVMMMMGFLVSNNWFIVLSIAKTSELRDQVQDIAN